MLGALLLITLGVLFLLNNLYPADFDFSRMWPIVLIVIGVVKIVEHFQRRRQLRTSAVGSLTDARPATPDREADRGEERP